jgi:circadian clock protein KaiC
MCFEEHEQDLAANVASIGFDLPDLVARGKLVIDHVALSRAELVESGDYSLDGLFIRLDAAISAVGAWFSIPSKPYSPI